ncbi:MAG: hypothetical protein JW717_09380 [Marinilabiliaceae bacterium]|nr:hypothetical protein [Marinilabiliaceae bacterium]
MIKIIIVVIILSNQYVTTQNISEQYFKGKVIDSKTKKSIPYSQIASYQMVSIFASDSSGRFNILTNKTDSLKIFTIGYEPIIINMSNINSDSVYIISLKQQDIILKQVDIHPRSREILDDNLRLPFGIHLGQASSSPIYTRSEVGGKPPLYAALTNPLSFGYYHLSKREKNKRKLANTIQKDKSESLLSNELLEEISGLKGDNLNMFKIYCNTNIKLSKRDNMQTVRFKLLDALHEFYKIQHHDL